jgi:hypothetical protein
LIVLVVSLPSWVHGVTPGAMIKLRKTSQTFYAASGEWLVHAIDFVVGLNVLFSFLPLELYCSILLFPHVNSRSLLLCYCYCSDVWIRFIQ